MIAADVVHTRYWIHRQRHAVCAHCITDVCDSAHAPDVTYLDYPIAVDLTHGDLLGERRLHEYVSSPRSSVCEHARYHDVHAVGFSVEACSEIGTRLAD